MEFTPDLTGRTLGKYKLTALLGLGGMGAVYRGIQSSLNREVAIKVLSGRSGNLTQSKERFSEEARIVASLEHPNIVPIHDYGTYKDIHYLVMRLFPNGSLWDRISDLGYDYTKFHTKAEVYSILDQIASALDYAHKKRRHSSGCQAAKHHV